MATLELNYGASNQAIACTFTSLASSATGGRASTAVSNTTTLSIDSLVSCKFKTAVGTVANDKAVYLYAYGSSDGGTTYTEGITGTDAAFTMADPTNLRLVGIVNIPVAATSYVAGPFSVANAFGGVLPEKWGIFTRNYTGLALSATSTDCALWYQLVEGQSV